MVDVWRYLHNDTSLFTWRRTHGITHFGFKNDFIPWIETTYSNIFAKLINNTRKSTIISLNRGVRQECPLSSLIYIMVAEEEI